MTNPDDVYEQLHQAASSRKKRSLELIHEICREQQERNSNDFSIATVGKLSKSRGGPSEQAIRNKNGESYRMLISAWQTVSQKFKRGQRSVAELRQLRGENRLLKSLNKDQIVIDRSVRLPAPSKAKVELLPAVPLSSMEIHALTTAIASQALDENGWQANPDGSIRNQHGRKIFEPGYVDAIEKVLEHTQK